MARIHLLSFPFERDEGEYAYMGKLILEGYPPYTMAYNMKLPGTYYMYALMMKIFGVSVVGVHLGTAIVFIISMLLIFLIASHFVSKLGASIASSTFGLLGTSWTLLAQAAHATHFVVFFALIGVYILLQSFSRNRYVLFKLLIAGLFFSFAFLCKQSGLFFMFFGLVIIVVKCYKEDSFLNKIKYLVVFIVGFILPVLVMISYFYVVGALDKFWFWTVKYLSEYAAIVPFSAAFGNFTGGVDSVTYNYSLTGYTILWIISLIGLIITFFSKGNIQRKLILILFYFFSFLTVLPGFYFRSHYFITLLPVTALMVGVAFDFFSQLKYDASKQISLTLFLLFLFTGIFANIDFLFVQEPKLLCKSIYGSNPFVESLDVSSFIAKNSKRNDRIAIFGSEPQIFFYADRYSATGYIYTYSLVEAQPYALQMQREMALEIRANKPEYVLLINSGYSWGGSSVSEKYIFNWANKYVINNYKLVALQELYPDKLTALVSGKGLDNYKPRTKEAILVYKKMR